MSEEDGIDPDDFIIEGFYHQHRSAPVSRMWGEHHKANLCNVTGSMAKCGAPKNSDEQMTCEFYMPSSNGCSCAHLREEINDHCDNALAAHQARNKK